MSELLRTNQMLREKCALALCALLDATVSLEQAHPEKTEELLLRLAYQLYALLSAGVKVCDSGTLPEQPYPVTVCMN